MKNILILADGAVARHFVEWVGRKRVADNRYYVTCFNPKATPEKLGTNITLIHADPTSFVRIKQTMNDVSFAQVFIVMEQKEDARYALKNVRMVDEKILVVLVDQWDDGAIGRDENNVIILNVAELMAAHLFDHLPNVPLIAQNVGLGKGEVMEVFVPFGSTYAYRHVGSILQRKWRIAAMYRNEKLILPTNATMIRPNDTLLIVGKPMVLEGIYRTINRRIGQFPEPFGKDMLLILDFSCDTRRWRRYLEETLSLRDRFEQKRLVIRILDPNDFTILNEIKALDSDDIDVLVNYTQPHKERLIEFDIQEYDIGWVLCSSELFKEQTICQTLWHTRKVVTLFGEERIDRIKEAVVLMEEEKEKMESISSTAFDAADALNLHLTLYDFDPEGNFEEHRIVMQHYETLAQIFNKPIRIEQKIANPVREVQKLEDIMQIIPFDPALCVQSPWELFKTKFLSFVLRSDKHPKLLVPYALGEQIPETL